MSKFIFINDAMNLSQMEALEKARELDTNKIALIETPRDSENSIDAWLMEEFEVTRFRPADSMNAVMSHDVIVIEEDAVSDNTLERLSKYAEVVE